jgi:outer membrane protein OmpA-like peptidoglycan-associated protein
VSSQGQGFQPNSVIRFTINSDKELVGTVMTDGTGKFQTTLPLPKYISLGLNYLRAQGVTASGVKALATAPVLVVAAQSKIDNAKFSVYYALNSATLSDKEKSRIRQQVFQLRSRLTAQSVITVNVTGWVQPTRVSPRIDWLSRNRAQAVITFMKSLGVQASYNRSAPGEEKSNTPQSRRADISITWTHSK